MTERRLDGATADENDQLDDLRRMVERWRREVNAFAARTTGPWTLNQVEWIKTYLRDKLTQFDEIQALPAAFDEDDDHA